METRASIVSTSKCSGVSIHVFLGIQARAPPITLRAIYTSSHSDSRTTATLGAGTCLGRIQSLNPSAHSHVTLESRNTRVGFVEAGVKDSCGAERGDACLHFRDVVLFLLGWRLFLSCGSGARGHLWSTGGRASSNRHLFTENLVQNCRCKSSASC